MAYKTEQLTNQIDGAIDGFLSERQTILDDVRYSQEYKLEKIAELEPTVRERVIADAQRLWGAPVPNDANGLTWRLDGGVVWQESERLKDALLLAEQKAEEPDIPPSVALHNQARAAAITARNTSNPDEFMKAYEGAPPLTRNALQDYFVMPGVARLDDKLDWFSVYRRLERDRQARLTTPEVQAAQRAMDEFATLLTPAFAALERVNRQFGRSSDVPKRILRNVEVHREVNAERLEERVWYTKKVTDVGGFETGAQKSRREARMQLQPEDGMRFG
ncbi:MAG: hypothetical protein M5R40_16440 [Anaerolineae bacterium]|nr:hypothetical protein [Anaerolineae bacterium]